MTFLAVDAQKNLFNLKKSQLQFEMTIIMNRYEMKTREMADMEANNGEGYEPETDPDYIILKQQSEILDTQKDSLDSQLTLLDAEINALKTLVQNNIKNSSGLNLIGQ
jgi:hypothetical protein